jgi:deazaflavin-dependent oxidoreductase (nitroreductase family)
MWFMNHIWNPIVRLILRSPLHGMMSKSLMLITYTGQKSGKEYTLPVMYLEDAPNIYVMPGMPEKKVWWHNIHTKTPVVLTVRGKRLPSRATVLKPESELKVIARVLGLFIQRNPPIASLFNIHRMPDGTLNPEDLNRAAGTTLIIQIKPQ